MSDHRDRPVLDGREEADPWTNHPTPVPEFGDHRDGEVAAMVTATCPRCDGLPYEHPGWESAISRYGAGEAAARVDRGELGCPEDAAPTPPALLDALQAFVGRRPTRPRRDFTNGAVYDNRRG